MQRITLAVSLFAIVPAAAQPVPWTQIAGAGIRSVDEPSLARSADGLLHIAWRQQANAGTSDLRYLVLDPEGKIKGEPRTAVEGWKTLSKPALLVAPDGSLELLFGGVRGSPDRTDPYNQGSLYRATAPADGSKWELQPGAQSPDHYAYLGPIGAVYDSKGQLWTSWPASMKLAVQHGLGNVPVQPAHDFGCCPYEAQVAADAASGEVLVGWYSNVRQRQGILLRPLAPALGEVVTVPGSYTESGGQQQSRSQDQQLGLTGRGGGPGVYVAYCAGYPVCTAIQLWRYRDPQPLVAAKVKSGRAVGLARGPEGRLWLLWWDQGAPSALRTNKAATRFGPPILLGQQSVSRLSGEGSRGPLDLLANTGSALVHTRVYPPLQVSAVPRSLEADKGGTVKFTVSDVGDPVAGATIMAGQKTLTTGADGSVSYAVPAGGKAGSLAVKIQAPGYQPAATAIEIRPAKPGPR